MAGSSTMKGATLDGATLRLDGIAFTDCTFVRCTLLYGGGVAPVFERCTFDGCTVSFDGGAANMLTFLGGLHASGPWGRVFVEGVLRSVSSDALAGPPRSTSN